MNIIYKNFKVVVIIALIIVIILMRMLQPTPVDLKEYIKIGSKEYELLSKKRDTVWNTKVVKIPTYVPVPIPGKPEPTPIPADVDTVAILHKYYEKVSYSDVQKIDSVGTVTINDVVTQNRIYSRNLTFNYKLPTITETIIVKDPPKNKMFVGGGINVDTQQIVNSVYGGVLFQSKTDKVFGINIGSSTTSDEIKPYVGGSVYWKIKLKKEK